MFRVLQLQTEIKIHRGLNHRHVVRFEDVFEDKENVYIIMELCTQQVGMILLLAGALLLFFLYGLGLLGGETCSRCVLFHTPCPDPNDGLVGDVCFRIPFPDLNGEPLAQTMLELVKRKKRLTEGETRKFMIQMLDGVRCGKPPSKSYCLLYKGVQKPEH